jgi:molybdopterin-guanine dinucleotide biosynthesis protein A
MKENKPSKYYFHPNEIALLGDSCDAMEAFYFELKNAFPHIHMCYIDGSHDEQQPLSNDRIVIGQNTLNTETDVLSSQVQINALVAGFDLVIINGHHFKGSRQLLFLNEKKIGSVKRRASELTNVIAIFDKKNKELPRLFSLELPFITDLSVINEIPKLEPLLQSSSDIPALSMLVLAGGKSSRMGEAKELINYHGKSQLNYLIELGKKCGMEVFVSTTSPTFGNNTDAETIIDFMQANGPIVGILSAFRKFRDRAFLVVACDMPFINEEAIQTLITNRDHTGFATCFANSERGWNEPLFAIWEPRSRMVLWNALGNDFSCPRKLLSQMRVKSIATERQEWLINANDQQEKERVKKMIKERSDEY